MLERGNLVRYLFNVSCGLVVLDIVLFVTIVEYRNFFGVIRKDGITNIIARLTPDILMVFFYTKAEFNLRKHGYISRKRTLVHSIVCSLIGLILCIPWIGMFLAPFSPIGSLYLSSILLFDNGYYISLGMAFIYVMLNAYIIYIANRNKRGKLG